MLKRRARQAVSLALALFMLMQCTAFADLDTELNAAIALTKIDMAGNAGTIKLLLSQSLEELDPKTPIAAMLQSAIFLLDNGDGDSVSVLALLNNALIMVDQAFPDSAQGEGDLNATNASTQEEQVEDVGEKASEEIPASSTIEPTGEVKDTQTPSAEAGDAETVQLQTYSEEELSVSQLGLPIYNVTDFLTTLVQEIIAVDVPADWGNNSEPGRAMTSYSPVNDSGAISPEAGTLTISYFPMDSDSAETAFDTYERNIAGMSVTANLTSQKAMAANLPARKVQFDMNVGANSFACEAICFAYEGMVYAIELLQGRQSSFDYFPAYKQVVNSAIVWDDLVYRPDRQPGGGDSIPQETPTPNIPSETSPAPDTGNVPQLESPFTADWGQFLYQINGHTYQFPTKVRDIDPTDIQINTQNTLPYDMLSDADMVNGGWTELANTQYFYFENSVYKEMVGLTNMSGYPVLAMDGLVTALIDTKGSYVNIVMPGGIHIGSSEEELREAFPLFKQLRMDGTAAFRGNELLYACNVRDDGCNGYVLIRNDYPFYSTVSLICDNGILKEISFECLGSIRAANIFI